MPATRSSSFLKTAGSRTPISGRTSSSGAEGLIGRSLIDDLVGPEDRTTLREGLSVAAATGEVVVETNHRRGDGTAAPVEMSVRRLTLDDDTHLVAVVRDLSARREVESALRRSEPCSGGLPGDHQSGS